MKRMIYASDLHGNKVLYDKLVAKAKKEGIENVVIGGDICPHIRGKNLGDAVDFQRDFLKDYLLPKMEKSGLNFFLIMGNDDFRANMDLLEEADSRGILSLLHKKVYRLFDKNILGYSFVNEMPFRLKDWEKLDNNESVQITNPNDDIRTAAKEQGTIEKDLEAIKSLSEPKNTIYVIHSPPFNSNLDIIYPKAHVGSKSVRRFIDKEQPILTLHGHIHESPKVSGKWMDKIGKTICINAGSDYQNSVLNCCIINLDNLSDAKLFKV